MANRVWAHFRPASEPLTPRITRQCSKKKRDRKSTRLNSSHLVISYAVFCLKKKTRLNSSHLVISYAVFCLKKKSYHNLREPTWFATTTYFHATRRELRASLNAQPHTGPEPL